MKKGLKRKKKDHPIVLQGGFLSSDEEDDEVEVVIPVRTSSSLQQKWSKFLLPIVTKFIGFTNIYPKQSGEGTVFSQAVV